MVNLRLINKAIKEGLSLEIARENEQTEKEQQEFNNRYKQELESLGVKLI